MKMNPFTILVSCLLTFPQIAFPQDTTQQIETTSQILAPITDNKISENGKEINIKDYFQPLIAGVKYIYSSKLLLGTHYKKPTFCKSVEFAKSINSLDGKTDSIFYQIPNPDSAIAIGSGVYDNLCNYSIDATSLKMTAYENINSKNEDPEMQLSYEEENGKIDPRNQIQLKIPEKDQSTEWENVSEDGSINYQKAYFGKCVVLSKKYDDCIIVESKSKFSLERSFFAKSIGLVKKDIFYSLGHADDLKTPSTSYYLSKIVKDENFIAPETEDLETFVKANDTGEHLLSELAQYGNYIGHHVNGNVRIIQKIDNSNYLVSYTAPDYVDLVFYLTYAQALKAVDNQLVHISATVIKTKKYETSSGQTKTVYQLKLIPFESYKPQ